MQSIVKLLTAAMLALLPVIAQADDDAPIQRIARPDLGFNFPYFVKLPAGGCSTAAPGLIVETGNTGKLSDDLETQIQAAKEAANGASMGFGIAKELRMPFLVSAFPRPESQPNLYTHALDRDSIELKRGPMLRLDLQLSAMIDDARTFLAEQGCKPQPKVVMVGFSASGSFANRYALLHPERLLAVVAGGVNGLTIIPTPGIGKTLLPYPLGDSDLKKLTGQAVDAKAFRQLPQLYFMGAHDSNDATLFSDAYSPREVKLVHRLLGRDMQKRFDRCARLYADAGVDARFIRYADLGHETDGSVRRKTVEFLRGVIDSTHEVSMSPSVPAIVVLCRGRDPVCE